MTVRKYYNLSAEIIGFGYNKNVIVGPLGRRKPHHTTGVWLSETQMSNSAVCSRPVIEAPKLVYRGVKYVGTSKKAQLKK